MRHLFASLLLALSAASASANDWPDPPALRSEGGYLTHVETALFEGPPDAVRAALQQPETGVLAFVARTERIAEITELTPITDHFPNEGAVRSLSFSDGSAAIERVLTSTPERFSYQVWGFTSSSARALSHIRGEFRYEPAGDGQTQVTWTYSIAPRAFLVRPFVRSFLKNDFAPFMASGLSGAAAAFNAASAN